MEHLPAARPVDLVSDPVAATIRATSVDVADVRLVRTRVARCVDEPQSCARQADPRSGYVDSLGPRLDARGPGAREWRTADTLTVAGGATPARRASGGAVEPL